MTNPDTNSLYVLICSLTATVISLPAVGISSPLDTLLRVWLPKDAFAVRLKLTRSQWP